MPIPQPKSNENEQQFVSRCMSAISGEYDDKKQASAVCYSTFREHQKSVKKQLFQKRDEIQKIIKSLELVAKFEPEINKVLKTMAIELPDPAFDVFSKVYSKARNDKLSEQDCAHKALIACHNAGHKVLVPYFRHVQKVLDSVDPEQLKRGIEVEHEHTQDDAVAEKIARDHLKEIPNYYTWLDWMESLAKKESEPPAVGGEVQKARSVGGFESPEPGDIPEAGKKLLAETYSKYRKQGMSKEESAKRAWGAVRNAGYKSLIFKAAPIGHISDRKDGKYKKISEGKWEKVSEGSEDEKNNEINESNKKKLEEKQKDFNKKLSEYKISSEDDKENVETAKKLSDAVMNGENFEGEYSRGYMRKKIKYDAEKNTIENEYFPKELIPQEVIKEKDIQSGKYDVPEKPKIKNSDIDNLKNKNIEYFDKYGSEIENKYKGLNPTQKKIVQSMEMFDDGRKINEIDQQVHSGVDEKTLAEKYGKDVLDKYNHFDEYVSKLPIYQGKIERLMRDDSGIFNSFKEGDEMKFDRYTSFGKPDNTFFINNGNLILHIENNTQGKDISNLMRDKGEKEVVLPKGNYKVVSKKQDNLSGINHIYLEEIK